MIDFVQTVLKDVAVDREYGLPETAFHLGNHKLFEFSREHETVNSLGSIMVNELPEEGGEENDRGGDDEAPQLYNLSKDRINNFENRHQDLQFIAEKDAWDNLGADGQVGRKDPALFSLYDFVARFKCNWEQRPEMAVPHFIPFYYSRPDASKLEQNKKFAMSMLRIFDPNCPPLTNLTALSIQELNDLGDPFFRSDDKDCPEFAKELWFSSDSDYRIEQAHFDQGEADIFPSPNVEEVVPDHMTADEDAFFASTVPPSGLDTWFYEDQEDDGDMDEIHDETPDYDRHEDRINFVNNWTTASPDHFRLGVLGQTVNNAVLGGVVPRDQLNNEQQLVLKYLEMQLPELLRDQSRHQFTLEICGPAGSGKTTVMRTFLKVLTDFIAEHRPTLSVGSVVKFCAPTGCAAKLLPYPHSTLHSLLHLPIDRKVKDKCEALSNNMAKNLQNKLEGLRAIVIDEKSFIGAWYLYAIDARLRQIFVSDLAFGGISVILMGDYAQLAPIKDLPVFCMPPAGKGSKYQRDGCRVFLDNFRDVMCLKKSMRQNDDPNFVEILDSMAEGPLLPDQIETLKERDFSTLNRALWEDATYLCAIKHDYREHNRAKILALPSPKVRVSAIHDPLYEASKAAEDVAGGLSTSLLAARGMRVMLTENIDLDAGLSNGSQGEVVGIIYFTNNENEIPTILVKFDEYKGPGVRRGGVPEGEEMVQVFPISAVSHTWTVNHTTCKRTMLPLVAAYAMSIHKSQGQTLGKIMLNLGTREFAGGLTYTALTRVRRLADLAFKPFPPPVQPPKTYLDHRLNRFAKHEHFALVKADTIRKAEKYADTLARYDIT